MTGLAGVLATHREDGSYPDTCLCETQAHATEGHYADHLADAVLVWLGETLAGVDVEAAILTRLGAKSSHDYQWPRWAAADEAATAAITAVREALGVRVEGLGADLSHEQRGSGLGDVGTGDTTTDGGSR